MTPTAERSASYRAERQRHAPEEVARRRMAEAIREEARQQRKAAAQQRQDRDCGWL